jgi:dUTP pyrophosphatase
MELLTKYDDLKLAPTRANPTDAGLDLRACKNTDLYRNQRTLVDTGVSVKIPAGFVGLLVPRSGLSKNLIVMTNSIGIIDSDYRGNIMASLLYYGAEDFTRIPQYERIVQLVIVPIVLAIPTKANEEDIGNWSDTDRGTGGFGSTGKL